MRGGLPVTVRLWFQTFQRHCKRASYYRDDQKNGHGLGSARIEPVSVSVSSSRKATGANAQLARRLNEIWVFTLILLLYFYFNELVVLRVVKTQY